MEMQERVQMKRYFAIFRYKFPIFQIVSDLMTAIHQNLPAENSRVLSFLTAHLRQVADRAVENSMDLRNLAKVFGPTLFRPNFDSFEAMACQMAKFEMAALLLLTHGDSI